MRNNIVHGIEVPDPAVGTIRSSLPCRSSAGARIDESSKPQGAQESTASLGTCVTNRRDW